MQAISVRGQLRPLATERHRVDYRTVKSRPKDHQIAQLSEVIGDNPCSIALTKFAALQRDT
jgi:hypothetical protein